MSWRLLKSLVQSNQGILKQKLDLLDVLQTKFGLEETSKLFTRVCPIVGASVGAHYRHSMDHLELGILVASNHAMNLGLQSDCDGTHHSSDPITLNYDLRVRGGTLERDVSEARRRIQNAHQVLQEMSEKRPKDGSAQDYLVTSEMINASFMLSSDNSEEFNLQSSIGRELGFVAHHAIHHLAMVRIIATHTLDLNENELPPNFGRAPSTINFENGK